MSTPASTFHALHQGPDILILPNAWDALSARLTQEAGAKAVATSSAAVAWAHGHADGHCLPFETLAAAVREIARVVSVPITIDMEGGYADDPAGAARNVRTILDAGVVGVNLEDGLDAGLLCRKIEAVRAEANRAGVDLFINARADVYLRGGTGEAALQTALKNAKRYAEAGASGFFLPGPTDPAIFKAVISEVPLPLNVMARKGAPNAAALQALGVRRLSAATWLAKAAAARTYEEAAKFLREGDSDALASLAHPQDFNAWFPPEG